MLTNKVKILIAVVGLLIVGGAGTFLITRKTGEQSVKDNFELSHYLQLKDSDLNQAQKKTYDASIAVLEKNPKDKDALIDLANVYAFLGDNVTAEIILKHILILYPGDTIALQNLASVYYNTKRFAEAETLYYQILDANILWMPAYDTLSQMYRFNLVPDNPKYVEDLQKARNSDYQDQYEKDLLRFLGFYYYYKKDYSSAIDFFRAYLKLSPNDKAIKQIFTEIGGSEIHFDQ